MDINAALSASKGKRARWEGAADEIVARFVGNEKSGLPRYLQLHAAVADLIRDGVMESGAQMPPEQYLAGRLGISLGTVQKGLQSLRVQGLIVREHGKGTFVSERRRSLTELKHFRFIDPVSGGLLPVYARLVDRSIVNGQPELEALLGEDGKGHVRLVRLIDVDERFCCYSEFFLPASRFGAVMDLPAAKLESVNLKLLFAEDFDVLTHTTDESVSVARPGVEIAKLIGTAPRVCGMRIEALGRDPDHTAFSFQRIFIPPSDYPLDISADRGSAFNGRAPR